MTQTPETDQLAPPPTMRQLFLAFARIGLTSFGGGISGWMLREFVQTRHWMTEEAFFNGLAISQAFPGVNVMNLSVWIGYQLRGAWGGIVASCGFLLPPMFVVILLVAVLDNLVKYPVTGLALAGAATAAIGLSFNMGLRALRRTGRRPVPAILSALTFGALFLFHLPLYTVVGVLAPISIALAYWRHKTGQAS